MRDWRRKALGLTLSIGLGLSCGAATAESVVGVTQISYDAAGRELCKTVRMNPAAFGENVDACTPGTPGADGADRITKTIYDAAGKPRQIIHAFGTSDRRAYTTFSYTPNDQVSDSIDANGNRTKMTYDGFDRLAGLYYPSTTGPAAFDSSTQATALATAGAHSTIDYETYEYDPNGNRTSWRRRSGHVITYQYDSLNREIIKDLPVSPGNLNGTSKDVYTRYDMVGNILWMRFGSTTGPGVSYTYDGLYRPTTTMDYNGRSLQLSYTVAGAPRTHLYHPDSWATSQQYDALNRVTNGFDSNGAGIYSLSYNALGQKYQLFRGASMSTTYGYDSIGRLLSMMTDMNGASGDIGQSFTYNQASQIKTQTSTNASYNYKEPQTANDNRTFNGLNQDATIASLNGGYDTQGNLGNDGSRQMTYDVENRLIAMAGAVTMGLEYDPLGRLAKTTVNGTVTTFLYDETALIGEYDGNGTMLRRYVHGPGVDEPLVWYEGAGGASLRYFVANYQGSIIAYTDVWGNLQETYRYGPYGEPRDASKAINFSGSRFRYTGQTVLAQQAALYNYKARVYDPVFGRFLQTDPIGSDDDVNLYAYTAGDPVNKTDPTGECGVFVAQCIGAAIGTVVEVGVQLSTGELQNAASEAKKGNWTPALVSGGKILVSAATGAVGGTATKTTARLAVQGAKALNAGKKATQAAKAASVVGTQASLGAASKVTTNAIEGKPLGKDVAAAAAVGGAVGTAGHYVNEKIGDGAGAVIGKAITSTITTATKKEATCAAASGGQHVCQ